MHITKWFIRLFIFALIVLLFQFWYHLNTSSILGGSLDIKIRGFYGKVDDPGSPTDSHRNIQADSSPNTSNTLNDIMYRNVSKIPINSNNRMQLTSLNQSIQQPHDKNRKIKSKSPISSLTYDDPKSYVGAVVEGWPPWRNRDVSRYMNQPFTSIPDKNKLRNKTLIVIVPSTPTDIDARDSCRRTWGRHANNRTSVLFLLGKQQNMEAKLKARVLKEKDVYGDIIHVNNLIEHYDNLTLKTLYAIKFFLQTDLFEPKPPKYLMKIDDDSFVNLPLLYQELTKNKEYTKVKSLVMGRCWCHRPRRVGVYFGNFSHLSKKHKQKIYQSRTSNNGKFVNKWIVPRYMYNGDRYPNYLSGSGYVLSRPSAECIFEKSKQIPYFHLEDIFITGFAAEACHIQPLHHPQFTLTDKGTFDKDKDVFLYFTEAGYMNKVKTKFANRISKYKPHSLIDKPI